MNILEINKLHVKYGPIEVLKGIDLAVPKGQIVAILGANGAGKTTVLRTISGLVKAASGSIMFNGAQIANKSAHRISRMGLCHAPEGRHIFLGFTTEENLKAGAFVLKKAQMQQNLQRVYELFPILKERRTQQANTLSGGEQQMLAIGRAMMGSPKLLVLDEPSLGLAPLIIKNIFKVLTEIRAAGTTILLVEQNAFATLKVADYAYVLELGKINIEGKASELINDSRLVEAYLGGKKA